MGDQDGTQPTNLPALGLAAAFLALLVEILSNLNKVIEAGKQHFYISLVVAWIAAIFLSVRIRGKGVRNARRLQWLVILLNTCVILSILSLRLHEIYEHRIKATTPAKHPDIRLNSLISVPSVYAAKASLTLQSFSLNTDLSNFNEIQDHKFASGPLVTSYEVDLAVGEAFAKGKCTGVVGEQPARAAVPVLRVFWSKNGRADLSAYLDQPDSLGRLIRERGDIFSQIVPTVPQLNALSPLEYEIVKNWLHDCVGFYNPVFTFTLSNNTDRINTVSTVVYHVLQVGQVAGGTGSPLYPIHTYDYALAWKTGDQIQQLNPAIPIPPFGVTALNLRLSPATDLHGVTWWMNIEVKDSLGGSVRTPTFQLTMNKALS